MFALLCLGASLTAHALDPSVRSWVAAEYHLETGQRALALPALEAAQEGAAAPLAILQLAMLRQAELTGAPETIEPFLAAVEALAAVDYDTLQALSIAQPAAAPGFDRAVVSRRVYADTAAALTLQAAVLYDARGEAAQAAALRERIITLWPDSVDGHHLRGAGGVATR